jgi:chemosensory pili system protein ChpA (sensor histidine kinase/response regulator)
MTTPPNVPKTVMLTDPDDALLTVHTQLLKQHFYDVKTAKDGLECVSRLRESRPDVLVLHRELRWGGGEGVLTWMRDHSDMLTIPVVLVTSETPASVFPQLTVAPVVRCLHSPYAFTVLLDAVRAAITGQAQAWERRQQFNSAATNQSPTS